MGPPLKSSCPHCGHNNTGRTSVCVRCQQPLLAHRPQESSAGASSRPWQPPLARRRRWLCRLVDLCCLLGASSSIALLEALVFKQPPLPWQAWWVDRVVLWMFVYRTAVIHGAVVFLLLALVGLPWWLSQGKQSPGQALTHTRARIRGQSPSLLQYTLRTTALLISTLAGGIGWWAMLIHPARRPIHDVLIPVELVAASHQR